MSLINKMLQDLDARGTPATGGFPSHVKPVAAPARPGSPLRLAGICAGGAVAGVAAAWFAWAHWHAAGPARPAALAKPSVTQPNAATPGTFMRSTIRQLPVTPPAATVAMAPAGEDAHAGRTVQAAAAPAPVVALPPVPTMRAEAEVAQAPSARAREQAPAREPAPALRPEAAMLPRSESAHAAEAGARAEPKSFAPMEPDSPEAREARRAAAIELATRQGRLARLARLSTSGAADKTGAGHRGGGAAEGRQESGAQRAENEYARALASLQDGRMSEALASLQQALRIDPGHDAARQTLVGLLVEANRGDDAIREAQAGLARDPRQPALAMLLARLQIERGGSGIDTLMRSLPYAAGDAEYHAFLAGALQRQGRQREAAEQYQQALRAAPANGVWWMGLGISLQADKRDAEALDAFRKARAGAGLSPELQAFVERRIQELGR